MEPKNELALISPEELSLVEKNALNAKQLERILVHTPEQYVKQRPAKGGGTWDYVTGGYIKKCLNLLFGWDWSFEIIDQQVLHDEAIVKGKLTCNSNGHTIIKMQFGNKDIAYKKERGKNGEKIPLSIGNDFKAAATDALKKCASEIGIAADIYNKEDFREVHVDVETISLEDLQTIYETKKADMPEPKRKNAERIINGKETANYKKLYKELNEI